MILPAILLLQAAWAPLPAATGHTIHSAALGEPRNILIVEPVGYAADSSRYPVVVLLDGDGLAPVGAAMMTFLQKMGQSRGAILVGVRSNSPADRQRLFLPPVDSAMRAFLETEVKPFIERRWRADGRWILAGHSLSALFAVSLFAQSESSFSGLIAISPVLGWQNGTVLRAAQQRLVRARAQPMRLFLSTADEGDRYPPTAVVSLDSTLKARRPAATAWRYRHYAGEDHGSTVVPALYDGLRFVLGRE